MRQAMTQRTRATVEQELSEARGELARTWPTEEPHFDMEKAPSAGAREALQRVIQLQNELESLSE
jgi:hypothetical protein